ncbi:hypothetical protein MtrunA17_Chr6g0480351 [Medicago truncatula]|uniref:Uncharacterized protein n=1 Tax=Medicago truncatula TaxID=3880 RepID=A0A396HGF4_MEDTR|nr:hypothetical protein MtrunA17_Chr6g0480351 [Medicago truncatula]
MDKELLKNEWIHVELKLTSICSPPEEVIKKLRSSQMGIHVLKKKSNMDEEDVVFTDPYIRKIKLEKYLNALLLQFHPLLKKQRRLVEVGVSETEILQQQHLALVSVMQNLVLNETRIGTPWLDRFLGPGTSLSLLSL